MQLPKNKLLAATALTAILAISTGVSVARAAEAASPLVTPVWLSAHLNDPNLVIIEVYDHDAQAPAFRAAHVPGAVFTGFLDDGWRVKLNGIPGMLPPEAVIAKVIGGLGVANNSRVVLVPGGAKSGDFPAVTRIYWTLRVEGHNNVSILNGGDVAWQADPKNPVASGAATPKPVDFVAHFNPALNATLALVRENLTSKEYQLVDARPAPQFEGKVLSPVDLKAGTIPGAINLPFSTLFTPDLEGVKDVTALNAALSTAGFVGGRPTIMFCNTGHLASADWFVLHEVLNHPKVRLYDGSMSEWTRDAALPVVNGKPAS